MRAVLDPPFDDMPVPELHSFVAGCGAVYKAHCGKAARFSLEIGKRYIRVVCHMTEQSSSVHCFVDIENGDVLKAAGWKRPAKHARGNIFDADNGLKNMGPFGPAYLR